MSDMPPPPPGSAPPPPPLPSAPPPPAGSFGVPAAYGPRGVVPSSVSGPYYSVGLVILLSIVTIGIWTFLWTYRTSEDLKKYNGDGLGGVLGVVLHLVFSPVLMFTIPNEIKNMYEREGRQSPVSAVWGLWVLLPLIGNIIWYVKVQHALNEFWVSKGARSA
jgi:uncharacterized protein DUF4234